MFMLNEREKKFQRKREGLELARKGKEGKPLLNLSPFIGIKSYGFALCVTLATQ